MMYSLQEVLLVKWPELFGKPVPCVLWWRCWHGVEGVGSMRTNGIWTSKEAGDLIGNNDYIGS